MDRSNMGNNAMNGGFANGRTVSNVAGVRRADDVRRVGNRAIDGIMLEVRTRKRVAQQYEINWYSLEVTAMLKLWEIVHGREGGGGPINAFIDWTGNAAKWKGRMWKNIEKAILDGMLERIPSKRGGPDGSGGYTLCITAKGDRVLDGYDRKRAEIIEEWETKRVTKMLEKETKRLKSEAIKAEREQSKGNTAGAPRFYRQSE